MGVRGRWVSTGKVLLFGSRTVSVELQKPDGDVQDYSKCFRILGCDEPLYVVRCSFLKGANSALLKLE